MVCERCGQKILPGTKAELVAPAGSPGVTFTDKHTKCVQRQRQESRVTAQRMTTEELTASLLRDFGMES
jgi:hypothetical protein